VRTVLTLCYHAVDDGWDDALAVTTARLDEQLRWALARGYRPARLTDAVRGAAPPRSLVVTFDDAFASVFDHAYPVLARLGIPATVFVPTALVTRGELLAWEGIGPAAGDAYLRPMSWDQLRLLAAEGWEIGSHTRSHPHLTQIAAAARADELEGSRADCEAHIGTPCTSVAYPYGDVDATVVEATRRAGYAVGTILGRSAPGPRALVWPRVGVYRDDSLGRVRLKSVRLLRTRAGMAAISAVRSRRRASRPRAVAP
jgi:peptidoglycan/xylan/chitin deacetylase (PgdA/CDA1 family)